MSLSDEEKQQLILRYLEQLTIPRKEPPLAWVGPFGKVRYNFGRIGRELFQVQPLPDGPLAIYEHDPDFGLLDDDGDPVAAESPQE